MKASALPAPPRPQNQLTVAAGWAGRAHIGTGGEPGPELRKDVILGGHGCAGWTDGGRPVAAHHGDEGRNAGGKQWPRDKHGPGHANLNDAWPAKTRPTLRQRPGQGPGARRRGGFPQEGHAAENVAGDQVVGEDGDGTADNPCPGREWIIPEGQPPAGPSRSMAICTWGECR